MTPILHRQRGAVTIMVAAAMLVLLAMVGLVLDSGFAYMVKARLNAAVDSAALAGARAVTSGNTEAAQRASAQTAAAQFFAANIPDGYLLSTPELVETKVTFNVGTVTIDVTGKAKLPLSIMQAMGFEAMTPYATAQTIRKDLDMMLVVDTSGSLKDYGSTVQSSAKSFLNKFNVTQDRVGLVHFASGAVLDQPIETTARGFKRDAMVSTITNYEFIGGTSSFEGMWHAREQLKSIPEARRSSLRVIVFFSDGAPTSFGTYLNFDSGKCDLAGAVDMVGSGMYKLNVGENIYVSTDCTLKSSTTAWAKNLPAWYNGRNPKNNPNDPALREFPIVTTAATPTPRKVSSDISTATNFKQNVDRAARNLAEAIAAKARNEDIYVFTLGMGASLKQASGVDNEKGEDVLKCMANVADGPSRCYNPAQRVGMYCYAATDADLTPCFSKLASAILRISK